MISNRNRRQDGRRKRLWGRGFLRLSSSLIPLIILTATPDLLSRESRSQQEWSQCKGENPDPAMVACSELIGSGKIAGATLAEAFKDRGRSYFRKGDYDRAI